MKRQEGEISRKVSFSGTVTSVQVRSTVWRYTLHNRTHRETGYNLFLRGPVPDEDAPREDAPEETDFSVAVSEKQLQKLRVHIGDVIQGTAWTPRYPEQECADYYKAGTLKKLRSAEEPSPGGPPWQDDPPDLATYAWRGARMLDTKCYKGKCFTCKWATLASVTIAYDFETSSEKHRFESFCYGPFRCPYYRMGRARAVPYKGKGSFYDDGMLDEACTYERRHHDMEDE